MSVFLQVAQTFFVFPRLNIERLELTGLSDIRFLRTRTLQFTGLRSDTPLAVSVYNAALSLATAEAGEM